MAAVIVLSTFPADQDPAPVARALVEERLAACVNVLPPMQSIYRWQGQIEQAAEHQLVIKTSVERVDALKRRLAELHPYDVPEIVVLPIAGGADAYLDWVAASTSDPAERQ
jgi:periplasmic divalent cation tolerance protein